MYQSLLGTIQIHSGSSRQRSNEKDAGMPKTAQQGLRHPKNER